MPEPTIRSAFSNWPAYEASLRSAVASLTEEQLAIRPSPERWPLWATIGHLACQRVFWLCDFAGETGAASTPFLDAAYDCPGDDDLENVLSGEDLLNALDTTFQIIDRTLDRWTVASLDEVIRKPEWDDSWVHSRGAVIQRVFAHDVYHCAEVNEILGASGLPLIDLWD